MLTVIEKVLNSEQISVAQGLINRGDFVDGVGTAGKLARLIKNNEELTLDKQQREQLDNIVMNSLMTNQTFKDATRCLKIGPPLYARYTTGMKYGDHADEAIMGKFQGVYRSDISVTVFLNSPDSYEGGELVINTSFGPQKIKLQAGDVVVYPSSSIHHVDEVKSGVRIVAVGWMQSLIRDHDKRDMLYRLKQTVNSMLAKHPGSEETTAIESVHTNLVRMWAEF